MIHFFINSWGAGRVHSEIIGFTPTLLLELGYTLKTARGLIRDTILKKSPFKQYTAPSSRKTEASVRRISISRLNSSGYIKYTASTIRIFPVHKFPTLIVHTKI